MPKVRPSQLYRNLDWEHLSNALLCYAHWLCNGGDPIPGLGIDAEDLVAEVMGRFWDPDDRVEYDAKKYGKPTDETVIPFLKEVLKNRFYDYLKRASHRHEYQEEEIEESVSDQGMERRSFLLSRVNKSIERARDRGDIEAELFLTLQLECYHSAGKPLTPAQAASEMGIEPSDIANIKKRIKRFDPETTSKTNRE